jgi:murein DD-endopeptidase MepM/ murein hydrolase activator NlpD
MMEPSEPNEPNDPSSIDTTGVRGSCAWCSGSLQPHHFILATRSSALVFCCEECLRSKRIDDAARRWSARRRNVKRLVVATFLIGACIMPHNGPPSLRAPVASVAPVPVLPPPETPLPGAFGPEWPPTEASLIADLGRDAWLHPLPGPFRRMPVRDSRVFGAERAGDRPIECRKGHCGIDLGGEIWGEQVHAAHDGIVDRVQRGTNDLHGGHYVRLAHRNGTVFTQYFHLAAIPRWVQVGVPVKAGDVIGLLGDTGVKESTAHLHFTVSVRPSNDWAEQYVDPEPLVALWPLRIPCEGSAIGLVSTAGKVGVPLGGAPVGATKGKHELAKHVQATKHLRAGPKGDEATADKSPAPADDEPASEASE